MSVGRRLRELGEVLDDFENAGRVTSVEFLEPIEPSLGPTAEIELVVSTASVSRHEGVVSEIVRTDEDGRVQIVLESTVTTASREETSAELEPCGVTIDTDGTATVTVRLSLDRDGAPSDGTSCERETSRSEPDPGAENEPDRESNRPPFRDPELLASIYDSCETFTEMSEAIEMDVTAETVRRYMIDCGIHEPNTYRVDESSNDQTDSHSEADAESAARAAEDDDLPESAPDAPGEQESSPPVALTDGIGLPDNVTIDALVESVSESNTVYEVKRDLDLERAETLDLLRQLDLVDLVVGRVASKRERNLDRSEIVDRLRRASAAGH